jgi:hypothetical protein
MLWKIHGTNFFHIKFLGRLTSNVKMDQCCPQLRFFILMVRLYLFGSKVDCNLTSMYTYIIYTSAIFLSTIFWDLAKGM